MADARPPSQFANAPSGSQPAARRNRGVVEQNGDDLLAPFERQRDLPADEIIRVIQAPAAVVAPDIQPFRSDQRQQNGALLDTSAQLVREDIAALDRVSVEKETIVAEAAAQIFMQRAAVPAGVAAAITDEDRRLVRHQKRFPSIGDLEPLRLRTTVQS